MMQRLINLILITCSVLMLHFQATAQNPTCGIPTNVAISNQSVTTATATWAAVTGALYYQIKVAQVGSTITKNYSSSQTISNLTYLDPSTAYTCSVSAVCPGTQVSAPSAAVAFATTANTACGTPQNVTVNNIAGSSATMSWTAVTGAQNYRIKLANSNTTFTTTYYSTPSIYQLNNLVGNTTYTYSVAAVCNNIPGAYSTPATFATPTVTCGTPTGAAVTLITSNSARIGWTALAGANTYKVEYKPTASTGSYSTYTTSSTYVSLYSLVANTDYTYRISAICAGVVGTPSATATFATLVAPACNAPSNITINNITSTGGQMSWTAVSGVNSYRINLIKSGTTVTSTYSTSFTSYNFTYLLPNTTYAYSVSSVCNGVVGTPSAVDYFTTSAAPACNAPTNLTATNVTAFGASLSWTAVPGVSYYRIVRTGGGSTITNSTSAVTMTTTGLSANTTYSFTVASVCNNIAGTPSAPISVTTLAAPACNPPSNVTVGNIDIQKASISWTPIAGVAYYKIQLTAAGATNPSTYSSPNGVLNLTSLQPNTTYTYAVASTCGNFSNVSAYSTPQTFTTLATGACNAPTNVVASGVNSFGATITWDSVPGVNYWRIQIAPVGTATTTFFTTYKASYLATNLLPSTAYSVNVTAVCPVTVYSNPGTTTFTTPLATVCPDANEPNNAIAAATPLTIGVIKTGTIETATDVDYFSFTNTAAEPNLKVTLSNLPKDYDLRLYNAAGVQVGSSMMGGTNNDIIKLANPAVGTYYAHVFGFASAFTPYSCYNIKAELSATPFPLAGGNGGSNNEVASSESVLEYRVFPNPVQQEATLVFGAKMQGAARVNISDLTGRIVKNYDMNVSGEESRFQLDLSDLQNGMYIMSVRSGAEQKSTKLMINK
jgi:hypothetical protein